MHYKYCFNGRGVACSGNIAVLFIRFMICCGIWAEACAYQAIRTLKYKWGVLQLVQKDRLLTKKSKNTRYLGVREHHTKCLGVKAFVRSAGCPSSSPGRHGFKPSLIERALYPWRSRRMSTSSGWTEGFEIQSMLWRWCEAKEHDLHRNDLSALRDAPSS